jgi:hypothetical protein
MMDDDEYGANWWTDWQGKPKYSEKPAPVPLCPPQIPQVTEYFYYIKPEVLGRNNGILSFV